MAQRIYCALLKRIKVKGFWSTHNNLDSIKKNCHKNSCVFSSIDERDLAAGQLSGLVSKHPGECERSSMIFLPGATVRRSLGATTNLQLLLLLLLHRTHSQYKQKFGQMFDNFLTNV
jgi:hypothetical protein